MNSDHKDLFDRHPSQQHGGQLYWLCQDKRSPECPFLPYAWARMVDQQPWRNMSQGIPMQIDTNADLPKYSEITKGQEEMMFYRSPNPWMLNYVSTPNTMSGGQTETPGETQTAPRSYGFAPTVSRKGRSADLQNEINRLVSQQKDARRTEDQGGERVNLSNREWMEKLLI